MVAGQQILTDDLPPQVRDGAGFRMPVGALLGEPPAAGFKHRVHSDHAVGSAFKSVGSLALAKLLEGDAEAGSTNVSCGQDISVFSVADEGRLVESMLAIGPACLLLDLDAYQENGFEILAQIRQRFPSVPVIVLSGQTDVRTVVRAMRQGACNFLGSPPDWEEIRAAIRLALPPPSAATALRDEAEQLRQRAATLTRRERTVIRLILRGRLNKEVACELGLALITVKVHRGNAMRKLGIKTAGELGRIAEFVKL